MSIRSSYIQDLSGRKKCKLLFQLDGLHLCAALAMNQNWLAELHQRCALGCTRRRAAVMHSPLRSPDPSAEVRLRDNLALRRIYSKVESGNSAIFKHLLPLCIEVICGDSIKADELQKMRFHSQWMSVPWRFPRFDSLQLQAGWAWMGRCVLREGVTSEMIV